jgi:hypothetical protein
MIVEALMHRSLGGGRRCDAVSVSGAVIIR